MNGRLAVLVAAMAGLGCGSGGGEPAAASPESPAAQSAGARCVALANVARERRPNEPDTITASHVLVKHASAKNPREGVTRSREQACLRAAEARDKVLAGAAFEDVVRQYSEEPGAETRAGSVGAITRAQVHPAFADAAFELDRGQMSDVVETDFGFHVILRQE